ncbi:hypothetical protein N9B82_02530 [Saprospiraceae bacterium]|nr:hypothetical protein [Saprospiraceae bacterium]
MKYLFFYALLLCLISCNEQQDVQKPIDFSNTDKIANADIKNKRTRSFNKGTKQDIVKHLYAEALNTDPQLKDLNLRFANIERMRQDSLSSMREFYNYNQLFYSSTDKYLSAINDTVKSNAIRRHIMASKNKFEKQIERFTEKDKESYRLAMELKDQITILKLIIAENLISTYQEGIPSLKSIDNVNKIQQDLIEETEAYTKVNN